MSCVGLWGVVIFQILWTTLGKFGIMFHKKRLVHVFPSGCSSEVDPYICHHLTIIRVHISYRRRKTLTNVASGMFPKVKEISWGWCPAKQVNTCFLMSVQWILWCFLDDNRLIWMIQSDSWSIPCRWLTKQQRAPLCQSKNQMQMVCLQQFNRSHLPKSSFWSFI